MRCLERFVPKRWFYRFHDRSFSKLSPESCLSESQNRCGNKLSSLFGNQESPAKLLSSPKSPLNTCCLLTHNGVLKIPYDPSRWIPIDEYLEEFPILEKVKADRLIKNVMPGRPFWTTEEGRSLTRSGLSMPYILSKRNECLVGDAYEDGNVGVLRGLDLLVFKDLEISQDKEGDPLAPYHNFNSFLKRKITKHHGETAINQLLPDYSHLIGILDTRNAKEFEAEYAIVHPSLLPDEDIGIAYCEIHRLLRGELWTRQEFKVADDIMQAIHQAHHSWYELVAKHRVLKQFRGSHDPVALQKPGFDPLPEHYFLVDVNRHTVLHGTEPKNQWAAVKLSRKVAAGLRKSPLTKRDFIQVLHYYTPMYLPVAYREFYKRRWLWELVGPQRRFPLPCIYFA